MNDKLKLYLTSGAILYAKDTTDNLKIIQNSANNGRTVVYDCYTDEDCTQPAVLNLINLEYHTKL